MYRKFDAKLNSQVLTIFAGEFYISVNHEVISTVLGSCIAVCLYDLKNGIGGMNHFMLPVDLRKEQSINKEIISGDPTIFDDKSMRYGMTAMEVLIAEMQKKGALRENLKAKIFGGGKVLSTNGASLNVGDKNIGFARAFLKTEGIPLIKESVGSTHGRKIYFLTGSDKVFVKNVDIQPAAEEERIYMDKLRKLKMQTDVTIF